MPQLLANPGIQIFAKNSSPWDVVVAQLAERSLPIPINNEHIYI